eukprot:scaffold61957_cov22-Cyclotella_meneghiniana.AAC.2
MDTLIRAVAAAKDGRKYTVRDEKWHVRYQELKAYREVHGHCNVSSRFQEVHGHCKVSKSNTEENNNNNNPDHAALVTFTASNRDKYRKSILSEERKALLDEIGFDWGSGSRQDQWDKMYAQLKKFHEEHGHCSPPEGELAKWARCQRGKDATLTEERKQRLNALGYVWEPHKTKWDGMFQKMLEYKEEFGDCDVPKEWHKNPQLGSWVKNQRKTHKNKKLSEERRSRLEKAGFSFTMEGKKINKPGAKERADALWDTMMQRLLEYKEKGYSADVALANWVRNNRGQYKRKELSQERITRLEEIGFAFS